VNRLDITDVILRIAEQAGGATLLGDAAAGSLRAGVAKSNITTDAKALFLQGAGGDIIDVSLEDFSRPRDTALPPPTTTREDTK
jgi:hypothetical protein